MTIEEKIDIDVAITGLAFRLPGIKTYENLSDFLFQGLPLRPKITEQVPRGFHGEFPAPGSKIEDLNVFDPVFFGMNNHVHLSSDRGQLKVIEVVFEALMDAGIDSSCANDVMCNVYQNTCRCEADYSDVKQSLTRYFMVGSARSMTPNRVSFYFDYKGTSISLDSGFSGGMQGLELGWRDIKRGRADVAIVTSSNVLLDEVITNEMNDLGWLSADGITNVFDNEAHGFVRTEGTVAFILQPAKQAKRIYANLRHVRCMSSENKLSLLSPTKESWARFLRQIYEEENVPKHKIHYLEAYGAANQEWDAAELNAVMDVLGADREAPLIVGSVKSNVGHSESTADLVSIIKAIICLENGTIPANKHYKSPNRRVPSLLNGELKVAGPNMGIPEDALIAVNGYSFGNVYGHCILEGFRKPKPVIEGSIPWLIPLSARAEDMLPDILSEVEGVAFDDNYFNLLHEVFSKRIDRHLARGFIVRRRGKESITAHQALDESVRPLWFVFSGMGSQWPGMGRDLMKLPVARNSIQKCHNILMPHGLDLIKILTADDPQVFKDNLNSFIGIAAVQIALVDILKALCVTPDGIIGHSLGELVCAYADGCLDFEQTILSAYYRGKAVKDATLMRGAMAAVGKGYSQLKSSLPENVEVACHNSDSSSTISGLEQPVTDFIENLSKDGVFAKIVEVGNIAFHSQFIAPAGSNLRSYMEQIIKKPKLRSSKWISSSVPESNRRDDSAIFASAEYFTNNLLSSVLFEEACSHIPENAILVEVAPHGLLQAIMKRSFPKGINISLTSRSASDNLIFLLQAIGKMYMAGVDANVAGLYPAADFPVPTKTNSLNGLFPWSNISKTFMTSDVPSKSTLNIRQLVKKSGNNTEEHFFRGFRCTPLCFYPLLAWNAFYQNDQSILKNSFSIRNLRILDPSVFSITSDMEVEGFALPNSHAIELTKNGVLFASALIDKAEEENVRSIGSDRVDHHILLSFSNDDIYDQLAKKGYIIAEKMRFLHYVEWTSQGIRAQMANTADWEKKIEALLHLVYLNTIREQDGYVTVCKIERIDVDYRKIESHGELELFYSPDTNELSCLGIYMHNVSFKRQHEECIMSFATFLPLFNPQLKNCQEFIKLCSSVVTSFSVNNELIDDWKVMEIQQENSPPLFPIIKSTSPKVQLLMPDGRKPAQMSVADLVICNSSQLHDYEASISKYALVMHQSTIGDGSEIPQTLSVVSTFPHGKESKMMLLKKKVIVNGERDFIRIPTKEAELLSALSRRAETKTNALLVGFTEPADGIPSFIRRIQSETSMALKWMFILDESAPEFRVSHPFYQEQLEKGLLLNVLLNGAWNFIYQQVIDRTATFTSTLNQLNSAGTDVMSCDPHLSWTVPSSWTVDNKDEIIAAYALAYHCLVVKAMTRSYNGVLVTDGCSLLGQAALAVALSLTDCVHATVASKEEAAELMQLFPKLKKDNLIIHLDENFPFQSKLRIGKDYPNIFYNLLEGKVLSNIFYQAPRYSSIFNFGKQYIETNHKLAMLPFNYDVRVCGVNADKIADWHIDEKRSVHRLVDEGLKNGVVSPIKPCHSHLASKMVKPVEGELEVDQFPGGNDFGVTSNSAYLIIGDGSHVDLGLTEWLVHYGAKKVFLHNPLHARRREYQRKIYLQKHQNIQVLNEASLRELISTTKRPVDKVEAIFFIHMLEDEPIQQVLIQQAVAMDSCNIIAISRNGQYARKFKNSLQCNKLWTDIVWRAEEYLVLQNMDVLAKFIGKHSYITVDKFKISSHTHSWNKVNQWLPSSVDSYCCLGEQLTKEPTLIELATLGPKMANSTLEIQPVFFFPGIEDNATEGVVALAKELLGPAFLANIPCTKESSILFMASSIIPVMENVAKRRVYNLVGISTGCVLAMEVARQMELKGAVVALLLADNPVQYFQQFAKESDMSSTILDSISFAVPNLVEGLQDPLPWNMRLTHIISQLNLLPATENWIHIAATHVNNYLNAIVRHEVKDLQLNGPLTVINSEGFKDQLPYRQVCVDHYINDLAIKHKDLIKSTELAKLINKFTVLDDAGPKSIHEVLWAPFEDKLDRLRMIVINSNEVLHWPSVK